VCVPQTRVLSLRKHSRMTAKKKTDKKRSVPEPQTRALSLRKHSRMTANERAINVLGP
jgi:hypothetical protein